MRTRNIDIAAYLHLCGLAPSRVEWDETWGVRAFHFADTAQLKTHLTAFNNDAHVPVRTFTEARAHMKQVTVSRKEGKKR